MPKTKTNEVNTLTAQNELLKKRVERLRNTVQRLTHLKRGVIAKNNNENGTSLITGVGRPCGKPVKRKEEESEDIEDTEEDEDEDEYSEGEDIVLDKNERKKKMNSLERRMVATLDEKTKQNFLKVREFLINNQPGTIEILNSEISLEDKAKLVELCEIYLCSYEHTEEKLELKERINKQFEMSLKKMKYKTQLPDIKTFSVESIPEQIIKLNASNTVKSVLYSKFEKLRTLSTKDDEYSKLLNWIKQALELPYNRYKQIEFKKISDITEKLYKELNKRLYGMKKVKEELMLFIMSKLLNPEMKGCSLGLIGKPGCGKTTIIRILSEILDLPFQQISFGSVSSASFIKGHEYTYIGAEPGEIVKCLTRMKYNNGILFFDEFDKIDDKSTIISTLLHITDFKQNHEFKDHFLPEIPIDLSNLWFIYSMNHRPTNQALKDRLYIIEVPDYTFDDKLHIVQEFLVPRFLTYFGLKHNDIIFDKECASFIINISSKETKGIRTLEQKVKTIIQKLLFLKHHQTSNLKVSFDLKQKIQFPMNLTLIHLRTLLHTPSSSNMYHFSMYC